MDIKKALLDIVNSEVPTRHSYLILEKLILGMLKDYLERQGKTLDFENDSKFVIPDAVLPDGIDNIDEKVALEIKMFRNGRMPIKFLYDAAAKYAMKSDYNIVLFIIISEIPPNRKENMKRKMSYNNLETLIWDINDLVHVLEQNEQLFEITYNSINEILIKEAIDKGIKRQEREFQDKKNCFIRKLHAEYENDNIVLFLGAGASKGAGIATWDTLISELFVALVDRKLAENDINLSEKEKAAIVNKLNDKNANTSLLQTRFLKNGFKENFDDIVRNLLYSGAKERSELLEEIGQLCIPNRGKIGIQAIVNYNFDDLIEKNLKRLRVKYRSIYGDKMIPEIGELGIYHVHGFLPEKTEEYDNLSKSLLVFSEDGYHKLMLDPYNWANIGQLNFILNNTCVFIGLSMTDPNLRRLLEVSSQKREDEDKKCKHYAILLRQRFESDNNSDATIRFQGVSESLQESVYAELDVNVIWIDNYNEIPNILRKIKDYSEDFEI